MSNYPWARQGKKLTDYDIPRIGHLIGVGEDEIHALLDVESRGTGYAKYGVILLFESHIFYRQLPKDKRNQALQLGLAHKTWTEAKRSGNYKNNYARFVQAYNLDEKAALESASFGLGQIMGFNHELAGYNTAREMVEAFAESEANQLEAMVDFIIHAGLDDELRNHNWAGFAKGYNGSGYKANRYDVRLRQRYEWWKKIPDTPWTPEMAAGEELEAAEAKPEASKQAVIPSVAVGGAGLTVVAASGLPLWAQFLLGFAVIVLIGYIIASKLDEDES